MARSQYDYSEFAPPVKYDYSEFAPSQPQAQDQSFLQKVVNADKQYVLPPIEAVSSFMQSGEKAIQDIPAYQAFQSSPAGIANTTLQNIQGLFNKGGEMTAEELGREGVNPYVAAGLGVAMQNAPNISMLGTPESEAEPSNLGATASRNFGFSALGFTKRLLKNSSLADKAENAVNVLTDEKVLRPFSTPEKMIEANSALAQQTGQRIGDYLKGLDKQGGKFFDSDEAVDALNNLRPRANNQVLRGGHYDAINGEIDNAIKTIQAHSFTAEISDKFGNPVRMESTPLGWEEANQLKGTLQQNANFNQTKIGSVVGRMIAGTFRDNLDKQLTGFATENNDLEGIKNFIKDKNTYAATQAAEDPLYNRFSSEAGNRKVGLLDYILGGAMLGEGGPVTAIAGMTAKHVLEKFGPQTVSVGLNKFSRGMNALTSMPGIPAWYNSLPTLGIISQNGSIPIQEGNQDDQPNYSKIGK